VVKKDDRLNELQHKNDPFYDGFSSYNQLDHGFEFIQQNLHWLIHMADRAREAYGTDSDQYKTLIGRVANSFGPFANGGNFTINELSHFDHFHHQTISDACILQRQLGQLPITSYQLGYNFVNVIPNKGNASGDEFMSPLPGRVPDNRINAVSPNTLPTPHIETPTVRTPTVNVGGVQFNRQGMSKSLDSLNKIPEIGKK